MTDQGHPVNDHLEAHIHTRVTGAVVNNLVPTIKLRDEATGASETLTSLVPMYDVTVGQSDLHFGNNVYLPDGTYTFIVAVGNEAATFANVAITGGAVASGASMSSMPMSSSQAPAMQKTAPSATSGMGMTSAPKQLPMTGGTAPVAPLALGALTLLAGAAISRLTRPRRV